MTFICSSFQIRSNYTVFDSSGCNCNSFVYLVVEGIKDEENVDEELLWNLEILSELVRCAGHELLPYKDLLEKVIESTIHLKCKKAYTRGSKVMPRKFVHDIYSAKRFDE